MYKNENSDSIFEISLIVVKYSEGHKSSISSDILVIINMEAMNIRRRVAFKNYNPGFLHLFSIISPGGKILCRPLLFNRWKHFNDSW